MVGRRRFAHFCPDRGRDDSEMVLLEFHTPAQARTEASLETWGRFRSLSTSLTVPWNRSALDHCSNG